MIATCLIECNSWDFQRSRLCCQGNHFLCLPFVTSFMFYDMLCWLYWHLLTKLVQFIHSDYFIEIHLISIFLFLVTFKTTRFTLQWKQGLTLLPLRHSSILLAADTLLGARVPHIILDTLFNPTTVEVKNRLRSQLTFSPPLLHSHTIPAIWQLVNIIKTPSYVCRNAPRPALSEKKKWPGSTYARWQL